MTTQLNNIQYYVKTVLFNVLSFSELERRHPERACTEPDEVKGVRGCILPILQKQFTRILYRLIDRNKLIPWKGF